VNNYLIFGIILTVTFILFFLVPNSQERFALSFDKVVNGEWWRFLTYQFVHLSWLHLIENILGVLLISFITFELRSIFLNFSLTYFLAGIFSIIPFWLIFQFTAAGASHAIFASLGFLAFDMKRFEISPILVLSSVFIIAGMMVLLQNKEDMILQQSAHIFGLFFGIFSYWAFFLFNKLQDKKKRRLLREL